jgi:hypothetical protein
MNYGVSGSDGIQALDSKTLSRLESAVSKSQYVGQGKKLKVTNKVCSARRYIASMDSQISGQLRYYGRAHCRNWRPNN